MTRKIKTAGVQLAPTPDRDRNLAKAGMLAEVAAEEGANAVARVGKVNGLAGAVCV